MPGPVAAIVRKTVSRASGTSHPTALSAAAAACCPTCVESLVRKAAGARSEIGGFVQGKVLGLAHAFEDGNNDRNDRCKVVAGFTCPSVWPYVVCRGPPQYQLPSKAGKQRTATSLCGGTGLITCGSRGQTMSSHQRALGRETV